MKNYLFDYVIVLTVKKEKDILKLYNKICENVVNINYKIIFYFDKSRSIPTYNMCKLIEQKDPKVIVKFDPTVKNLADAYYKAYLFATTFNCRWVLSMNAGFRHNPADLKKFILKRNNNNDCIWGVRSNFFTKLNKIRGIVSLLGHVFSSILLQVKIDDLTSGFYSIKANILKIKLLKIKKFKSRFHFLDTELKFLLRKKKFVQQGIFYKTYNKKISFKAIIDSLLVLMQLFFYKIKKSIFNYTS